MADIVLAIIVAAPLIFTIFLRSNGALAFLALCTGYVVYHLTAGNLSQTAAKIGLNGVNTSDIGLILLALPVLLTFLFTLHSFVGKPKIIMQSVAAVLTGAVLALASAPLIATSLGVSLTNSKAWPLLESSQSALVGVGALYCLLLVWLFGRKSHASKKHKK